MIFLRMETSGVRVRDKMRFATHEESEGLFLSLNSGKGAPEQAWHGSSRELVSILTNCKKNNSFL